MTAMRSVPLSCARPLAISSRMERTSPTMRRAQARTRSPSAVTPWKRDPRLTSVTPNCSSRCRKPADRVGCVMPRRSAARPK